MKIKEIKIVNQDQSTEIANIGADAINVDYNDTTVKNELDKLNSNNNSLINKQTDLQNQINGLASGSPLVANSVNEMTDTSHVYVNTSDGHWYWNNGTTWVDCGVYQATEIAYNSIIPEMTNFMEGGVGINKFSKNKPGTMPYYIALNQGAGTINSGNQANRIVYCKIKPSTQYNISTTISNLLYVGSCTNVPTLGTSLNKASNLKLSPYYIEEDNRMSAPYISTENDNYLVIQCITSSSSITIEEVINNLQVEEGPVFTVYTPYEYSLINVVDKYTKPYSQITIIEKTINNTNIKIWIPASYTTKGIPCVIGFHGNGSNNNSWTDNNNFPDRNLIRENCINNGYIFAVAENINSLYTWGNKQCVETYMELFNYLKNNFVISKFGVFANSMGGIESLNFITEKKINISCYVGTSLTFDLEQIYNNGQYKNRIKTAYNIEDDNEFEDKTKYKNPATRNLTLFGSFPCFIIGASDDTNILQQYNGFKFADLMNIYSNVTKIITTGGHAFDITNYINDIMNFYSEYLIGTEVNSA